MLPLHIDRPYLTLFFLMINLFIFHTSESHGCLCKYLFLKVVSPEKS